MEFHIKVEMDAWVDADNAERAMDRVDSGEIQLNPLVLIRCPAVGVARVSDVWKLRFLPSDPV